MNPTTDTPRTDTYTDRWNGWDVIPAEVSRQLERELAKAEAEVERLRGLLNAHAEFLIKNGFYRESRDLMGGSWSDGFVALAKKCGINPYDQ